MIEQMWPGMMQPITAPPEFERKQNLVEIRSATPGATIGYRWTGNDSWAVYSERVPMVAGQTLEARAQRYGFAASDIATFTD